MYDWVTLLCNKKWHSIVNQLYFDKTVKNEKKKERKKLQTNNIKKKSGPVG